MIRLADYVVVVGYDFMEARGLESQGRVIQRFPKTDWKNYPYDFHVETFCQPCGWRLVRNRQAPTFFVAYLTDMRGNRYYAACLTFYEAVTAAQLNPATRAHATEIVGDQKHKQQQMHGDSNQQFYRNCNGNGFLPILGSATTGYADEILDPNLIRPPELFAPKCLVLLARHHHLDVLKNCLNILYTVFMDAPQEFSLEQIIGNIIGSAEIPPIGGPRVTFSVGANDRQTVQPARFNTIPVTRCSVANLFKYLGIHNVILMFSAVLSDQKLILCSQSLCRLTDACHALTSIIYPLKYGNTYVPVLPKTCLEYISAPTPFLYGIHASYYNQLSDMGEVLVADLDVGSVICPDNVQLPQVPQPFLTEVVQSLYQILSPDMLILDHVYPPASTSGSESPPLLAFIDKQIRAVFLRLFASLFAGYRSCLTITRIHPQPVIHFNQSLFLVLRSIREPNDFFDRILSSMRFHQFIQERGPPFRVCDIFDEENDVARSKAQSLMPQFIAEALWPDIDYNAFAEHFKLTVDRLAQKLLDNESDGFNPLVHFLEGEASEAHFRLHQSPFPIINAEKVDEFAAKAHDRHSSLNISFDRQEPRFVPKGEQLDRQAFKADLPRDKCRVIREFVADIFNRHITEALKRRNTIRQDLKSQSIRRLFVDELYKMIIPWARSTPTETDNSEADTIAEYDRRASLNWDQFDLIIGLLDESLRYEGMSYNTVIAPFVMELTTRLRTQLGLVRYYANMTPSIQRHSVWSEMTFWEDVFNEQVNGQLRQLYVFHSGEHQARQQQQQQLKADNFPTYSSELTTLEIAAEELRVGNQRPIEVQASLQAQEEGTVCAQILHFVNLIINFRVPLRAAAFIEQGVVGGGTGELFSSPGDRSSSSLGHAAGTGCLSGTASDRHNTSPTPNGVTYGWSSSGQDKRLTSFSSPRIFRKLSEKPAVCPLNTTPFANVSDRRHGGGLPNGGQSFNQTDRGGARSNGELSKNEEFIQDLVAWLMKFVEKVGSENFLPEKSIIEIQGKIESILEGHLLNLADIYPEVKKIPKIKKPEIVNPALLPGESLIHISGYDCLPCQLLVDGRTERGDWTTQADAEVVPETLISASSTSLPRDMLVDELDTVSRSLLPAQGALFITNYRVIFIGVPKDPYQSNKVVCRSFPVSALHSVKRLGTQRIATFLPSTIAFESSPALSIGTSGGRTVAVTRINAAGGVVGGSKSKGSLAVTHGHHHAGMRNNGDLLDVIRLRSITMQMLRLGFDPDEVTSDARDYLRQVLYELRVNARLNFSFNTLVTMQTSTVAAQVDLAASNGKHMTPQPIRHPALRGLEGDVASFSGSSTPSLETCSFNGICSRSQSQVLMHQSTGSGSGYGDSAVLQQSCLFSTKFQPIETARSSSQLHSDSNSDAYLSSSGTSIRLDEVGDILSALVTKSRFCGIDPAVSEVFQQSLGYQDLAQIAIRACHGINTNKRFSNSPLSSMRSETSIHSAGYRAGVSVGVSFENSAYEVTPSYPSMLVVPSSFTKSGLARVARSHRQGRFPVIVWHHPETQALLLRGSAFQNKSILSALKHTAAVVVTGLDKPNFEPESSEISSTKEYIRYVRALVDISPNPMANTSTALSTHDYPTRLPTFDDSGLSVAPSCSSTASPSISTAEDGQLDAQQPTSAIPIRRRLRNDPTESLLRASRASSKETFVWAADLALDKHLSIAVTDQKRLSACMFNDSCYSIDDPRQMSVFDLPSTAATGGKSAMFTQRRRAGGARYAGGVLGRMAGGKMSQSTVVTSVDDERNSMMSSSTQYLCSTDNRCPISLFVLSERSIKPAPKLSQFLGVEFISVEYASQSEIKDAFAKLYNACLPKDSRSRLAVFGAGNMAGSNAAGVGSSIGIGVTSNLSTSAAATSSGAGNVGPGTDHDASVDRLGNADSAKGRGIYSAIAESGWLTQIQSMLQLAGVLVDILGFQGVSVAVCLEEGCDVVAQVVCLAQVMLDPTYRTIRGFWSLIEKEWLLFGHCFNQCVGQRASPRSRGVSPVFLQFLDAMHQLLCQFPMSFEFNDFFLQFLAYHHVSNRFHNFKFDHECERLTNFFGISSSSSAGIVTRATVGRDGVVDQGVSSASLSAQFSPAARYETHSVWNFIHSQHEEWPIFFNIFYSPERGQKTLIPVTSLFALDVWKYYLSEDLATGPVYDLDLFCPSYRKQTNRNYDPVIRQGYNNTHVEQTYALLGLREGEDAIGWLQAWREAQEQSCIPVAFTVSVSTSQILPILPPLATHDLSEEAAGDFDRNRQQLLHNHAPPSLSVTTSPDTVTINTTLKPGTLVPPDIVNQSEDYFAHSLPKPEFLALGNRCCRSDLDLAASTVPIPVVDDDDGSSSLSSNDMLTPGELARVTSANGSIMDEGSGSLSPCIFVETDKCSEARSAVMAQHRTVTMRRLNKANHEIQHGCQASTLAAAGVDELGRSSRSFLQHSGSLNALRITEDLNESADNLFERPHKFERLRSALSVTRCDLCQALLFATTISRGVVRCIDCHMCCHEKCAPQLPRNCRGVPCTTSLRTRSRTTTASGVVRSDLPGANSTRPWNRTVASSLKESASRRVSETSPDFLTSPGGGSVRSSPGGPWPIAKREERVPTHGDNVAFSSELHKLGHRKIMPQWKPRFFVLDTEVHQMRYYDTEHDEAPRGHINLQDVRWVQILSGAAASSQKHFPDNCIFEIDTGARQFRFAADKPEIAITWVEKIRSMIL